MGLSDYFKALFGSSDAEAQKPSIPSTFIQGVSGYSQTPPEGGSQPVPNRTPVMDAETVKKLFPAVNPDEVAQQFNQVMKIIGPAIGGGGGGAVAGKNLLDTEKIYADTKSELDRISAANKDKLANTRAGLQEQIKGMTVKPEQAPGSTPRLDAIQGFLANLANVTAGLSGSPSVQRSAEATRAAADASIARPFLDALAKDEVYSQPVGMSREGQQAMTDKVLARKKELEANQRENQRMLTELDITESKMDADTAKTAANLKADLASKAATIQGQLMAAGISAGAAAQAAKLHILSTLFTRDRYDQEAQIRLSLGLAGADNKADQNIRTTFEKLYKENPEAAMAYLQHADPASYDAMMRSQGKAAVQNK